ncbi:hypothetical protein DER45DRAFT_64600 [Fusarium avenaceum]|nr:hypothetical protein DER45DRAFT_64600 [Fusarium avenaceum]
MTLSIFFTFLKMRPAMSYSCLAYHGLLLGLVRCMMGSSSPSSFVRSPSGIKKGSTSAPASNSISTTRWFSLRFMASTSKSLLCPVLVSVGFGEAPASKRSLTASPHRVCTAFKRGELFFISCAEMSASASLMSYRMVPRKS